MTEPIAVNEELLRRDTTHEARERDLGTALSLVLEKRTSAVAATVASA
ncbi:hypothetical protein WMF31_15475 [Sorangium sp. So ce1036]|nr:hypothetical protein [Sorangium cellulosum]